VDASMGKAVVNDKSQVQVIARAATILRALEDENTGLSLGQIAQRVSLARSTVQRIVSALETEKLVIAATPNGRVRLGPAILRLASSVRSDFLAMARPFLERLSQELEETVDLATVKKDQLIFIDQVIGSQRLRTVSAVGESFPRQRQGVSCAVVRHGDRGADRRRLSGAHAANAHAHRDFARRLTHRPPMRHRVRS
jgi:DNA-binding IclR family transcriptional regulator